MRLTRRGFAIIVAPPAERSESDLAERVRVMIRQFPGANAAEPRMWIDAAAGIALAIPGDVESPAAISLLEPLPADRVLLASGMHGRLDALRARFAGETSAEVLGAVAEIVQYSRPDDYVQTLKARTEAVSQPDAESALKEIIKPSALTWVIVGDLKKIEQPVRALKQGEIEVIDGNGKPVPGK